MLPTLETSRLRLRPFVETDLEEVVPLIGTREVAATTLRIPHPYTEEHFRFFMKHLQTESEPVFAIALRSDERVMGGMGLRIENEHRRAELGYWIGLPYWGQGYASEAAREVLRYGFEDLNLHRIFADHFEQNAASGRVLVKIGMRYEGRRRQHILKWDRFLDAEQYGILQHEWKAGKE